MHDVDVAIVGAGPTGLALAAELRLAGISCRILERREDEPNITRAFAVHARTLELLDGRGLADDLVPRGVPVRSVAPAPGATVDLSAIPSRYPMVLIVPQSGTEKLLADRAVKLGAQIVRGAEVVGLDQDDEGVRLRVVGADGEHVVSAAYVVGTDGAHSAVRRLLGIDFVGAQYETHILLADVQLKRPPGETLFGASNAEGLVLFVPFGDGWFRAIAWDRSREQAPLSEPVTLDELRSAFSRIAGDDFGMGELRWQSRFLSERRQAAKYRVGRVFLAGDAAHVHSPVGGQGMNTGIGDAMNLGWKLAATLHGWGPAGLLDTYQAERHPVGASVLKLTDNLYKLVLSGSKLGAAVRQAVIRRALRIGRFRAEITARLSGIGIHYDAPAGSPAWAGRRYPDYGAGGRQVYEALRAGTFVLVSTGEPVGSPGWADRVVAITVTDPPAGTPAVTLIRPDGYVAWAADTADGLPAALQQWCGPVPAAER